MRRKQMEKQLVVKIDIDGVIRDISTTMVALYNETFKTNMTVDRLIHYDVDDSFPRFRMLFPNQKNPAVKFFFEQHAEDVFLHSEPYYIARYAINKLQTYGYKVVLVTWQTSKKNKQYTLDFLEYNGIPYDDICFTRDKWIVNGDWMIDDNPEFLMDERDSSRMIKIVHPYNKHFHDDNIVEAASIAYAVNYIIKADFAIGNENEQFFSQNEQDFSQIEDSEEIINRISE